MSRKGLIVIAFLIAILLVIGIIAITMENASSKTAISPKSFSGNNLVLYENDNEVIQYGKDVYLLDTTLQEIIKSNLDNGSYSILKKWSNRRLGQRIFIRRNHLIYSYDNQSFYCDLNGNNETKILDGEISFINDDTIVYIYHNSLRDELFITSYLNSSLQTTNDLFHCIAQGSSISFLKEDGNRVYFVSNNTDNTTSLLELDVDKGEVLIIDRMERTNTETLGTMEYTDVMHLENECYLLVSENTILGPLNTTYAVTDRYLFYKSLEGKYKETIDHYVGPSLAVSPKNSQQLLYEVLVNENAELEEKPQYEWKDLFFEKSEYTWKDLMTGDVTFHFSKADNNMIQMDGNDFCMIDYKVSNSDFVYNDVAYYSLKKVVRLAEGYCFLLEDGTKHLWYYCQSDGSQVKALYEKSGGIKYD